MTSMQLHKFNGHGIQKFREFLARAGSGGRIDEGIRRRLLQDDACTLAVDANIEMDESVLFKNRYAAAEHLFQKLKGINNEHLRDTGLWAWLALFFVRQLCAEKNDRRIIGRDERYIPDFADYRFYYRHLLYGPFHIYREHQEKPGIAMVVLCTPVHAPGDAVEALSARQHLITNPSVMSAATLLYVADGKHKRGAGRKDRGGARRFAAVLMQFNLTYDLYQITAAALIELLPPEFDEFAP